ncbi:3-methyl-2-oxobutanoate hydroxymethyltransferase [Mycena venus]|uniref:3-methyl-2-oxobutanoate hydroxymethyltransferase n=1 Tax=Mycena venus TaxID=2733690 RepID=A0A8H6YPC8_9AGAR|nr:3-methyl-2-oxobutanoate hydroxymethyltransferase [Mycena venus]
MSWPYLARIAPPTIRFQRRWMSVRPKEGGDSGIQKREKVTIQTLQTLRESKVPISMLTAYDYSTALSCSSNPAIDITLVGDSLAQVCLGYKSTTQLTLDEMIHHAKAVARGTTHPLLVADMPFGSYHGSMNDTVNNAVRMVRESQIEAVKLEGGEEIADLVHRLTSVGIPVMAHVGLLPQRHVAFSGYKVQGRNVASAKRTVKASKLLEQAGAFSMVVEAIPKELGRYITENVLVWDDAMGTWLGHKAKFVRRFANLQTAREVGVQSYANAVKDGSFPDPQRESYTIDQTEWTRFLEEMDKE